MKIFERTNYGISDIVNQIKSELGLIYVVTDDRSGKFYLGEDIELRISFTESDLLENAEIVFPDRSIDITTSRVLASIYSSAIDTSFQVVSLIQRMTGEVSDEDIGDREFEDADEEEEESILDDQVESPT